MQFTKGIVIALTPSGFRIANTWGSEQDIQTMTAGDRLALAVGDRVTVYGGVAANGAFATSSISVTLPSGEEIEVRDEPVNARK
ncbi:MAG: hypothetical protein M3081_03670 [Gemmatimonadota bacterium]|nr:hypothetical protein [Gemmatimonadota bacterium]